VSPRKTCAGTHASFHHGADNFHTFEKDFRPLDVWNKRTLNISGFPAGSCCLRVLLLEPTCAAGFFCNDFYYYASFCPAYCWPGAISSAAFVCAHHFALLAHRDSSSLQRKHEFERPGRIASEAIAVPLGELTSSSPPCVSAVVLPRLRSIFFIVRRGCILAILPSDKQSVLLSFIPRSGENLFRWTIHPAT